MCDRHNYKYDGAGACDKCQHNRFSAINPNVKHDLYFVTVKNTFIYLVWFPRSHDFGITGRLPILSRPGIASETYIDDHLVGASMLACVGIFSISTTRGLARHRL